MSMNIEAFDLMERNLAFAPALVDELPALVVAYGAEAYDEAMRADDPDGASFPVIFARWDDQAKTRLRAASRDTERPTVLNDGRLAIENALFTKALLAAVQAGAVAAAELTSEQVDALRAV
jgi:hypothetical protein